ncbi:YrdB family protein [Microbacterium fluvii]|uniref:YrdB family protein n=1 Tax=Microbacterium fluvii TaxID=415215 RepID=A0ABW2H8P7_9MICO|nr:YrdB family protein [Microbacterium fluvii]MCU4671339.1 YrdB family protein [Microbacterium fluvii]
MSDLPHVAPSAPAQPAPAQLAPGTRAPLSAIDILAFVCELFAFGSLALWGFVSWPLPWNIVAGIGAPVVAILVWALFVSPRAVLGVHPFVRAVVELLVYVSATIAWWSMGAAWVGLAFGVIAVTVGVIAGRRRFA